MKRFLATLACLAFCLFAWADKVVMKDGRQFEGAIVDETDEIVKLKMSKGTIPIRKSEIDRIERGTSGIQDMEARLEALTTDNPSGYVDLAAWCIEQNLGDPPTIRRLANIGIALDDSLASRGNSLLGDYMLAKGDRGLAATYYLRAYQADWKNAALRHKLQEHKEALAEERIKQVTTLRDGLQLALDSKWEDAIRKLQAARETPMADQIGTYSATYKSFALLLADLRARVPCKTCSGTLTVKCLTCKGVGNRSCTPCGGKGRIRKTVGGRPEETTCTTCKGSGKLRCEKCAGKARTACPTCKGIRPATASTLDVRGLKALKDAADARTRGSLPIEEQVGPKLPKLGLTVYDEDLVDDGRYYYAKGEWVSEK